MKESIYFSLGIGSGYYLHSTGASVEIAVITGLLIIVIDQFIDHIVNEVVV